MKFTKEYWLTKLKQFVGIKTAEEVKIQRTWKVKFIDFIKSLGSAGIAALIIITFVIQNTRIPTGSMEDTILVGDFVLVNKFIFGSSSPHYIPFLDIPLPYFTLPALREPKHGDIVVFEYPGESTELHASQVNVNYVKRCIGLPGDTIEVRDKVAFVNGKEFWIPTHIKYLNPNSLPKGFADDRIFPQGAPFNEDNYGPIRVPKKGDVIQLTMDNIEAWRTIIDREFDERVVSTENNTIKIKGNTVSSYTIQKDYYFMMGDNRNNSYDSRFWGFVSRDRVVGMAFITLLSWDREIPFSEPFAKLASIRPDRILKVLK